jgi:branched-chain amino acid transport system permease protein
MDGLILYLIGFATLAGIAAISTLGLNVCWGMTGLFNLGIAGFYGIGAYTSAILTAPPSPETNPHLGGFSLPVPIGCLGAMGLAAVVAWIVGRICVRLRADYLAIATIGIAEIIRITFSNWEGLGGGAFGVQKVPRPFQTLAQPYGELAYLGVVLGLLLVTYLVLERGMASPWGRAMRAIRDNEIAAAAVGKDVERLRLQAFVYGSAIMGLAGALSAHYLKQVVPEDFNPLTATFLIWVMLITGGSGNNRGAILGALVVWAVWTMSEFVTGFLSIEWATRAAYGRIFLVGLLLQVILQFFPHGLLAERAHATPSGE